MGLRNDKTIKKTFVFFVRHGERIHIPGNRNIGLEIPGPGLSPLGKKQAKITAKIFGGIQGEVDRVYCSKMARAVETANAIGKVIGREPNELEGLCEIGSVFWERNIFDIDFWRHFGRYRRARKIFDHLLEENNGKTILIVAHGTVIKSIIGGKLGLPFRYLRRFSKVFYYSNGNIVLASFDRKRLDRVYYFNSKSIIEII